MPGQMRRRRKYGLKRNTRRRILSRKKESDESDEDYDVGADEESDEYCSFEGDESEESFSDFEDGNELKVKKIRKENGTKNTPKKKRVFHNKQEDDYDDDDSDDDSDDDEVYNDDSDDDDGDDDEDDEEFTLDKIDYGDDEDDMEMIKKTTKVRRSKLRGKRVAKEPKRKRKRKRNRKSKVLGKPVRKKSRKSRTLVRKRSNHGKNLVVEEKNKKLSERGRRRIILSCSDSDFVSSESSDYEYTISEEEREQVRDSLRSSSSPKKLQENETLDQRKKRLLRRKGKKVEEFMSSESSDCEYTISEEERESNRFSTSLTTSLRSSSSSKQSQEEDEPRKRLRIKGKEKVEDFGTVGSSDYEYTLSEEEVRENDKFFTSLTTSLRSSSSSKRLQEEEEEALDQRWKRLRRRKGKEKVEDLKNEIENQACGICLSEEGKKIVRGTLNCCSHYFCFPCIMEWSKVESRCPLCKQRFTTISKPAKSNTRFDPRNVTIQVPVRDQVYQPSEEELMGYIDPYENVICTECLQGGDDGLMLLCDICDSSAHTYCVGLGHEVPEGNWYCEGCRPTDFGSSTPQAPDQITNDNLIDLSSPALNGGEVVDLTSTYVPDTPLTPETSSIFSLGHSNGDSRPALVANTVSDRRRVHRHVRHLFGTRSSLPGGGLNSVSDTTTLGDVSLESESQHGITPEILISGSTLAGERLPADSMSLVHNMASDSGLAQMQPPHPRTIGYDGSTSHACREESRFSLEKGQVQERVKTHLRKLSRDTELEYSRFKEVARSSTHTILAACGLEHREGEVYQAVQPPRPTCDHVGSGLCMRMSLMKGHCQSCFDLFVRDVVRKIMLSRIVN